MSTESTDSGRSKRAVLEEFRNPVYNTQQAKRNLNYHTDARDIREVFGIAPWDRDRFDYDTVLPDCFEHTWDAPRAETNGGTDFLCRGKPGKGKSTFGNYVATRMMEINEERVVWRGSSSRSEWLPLAPWARLCLPSNVEIEARLEPKKPTDDTIPVTLDDLEGNVVREIVRYDDPLDLNENKLQEGAFHVVYPDPRMRGCQEVYEASPERQYESPGDRDLFHPDDPASHWWFAWALARVEHGPHHWTTWVCDEIGDLAPQTAMKDEFGTYQKVELLKDVWVDMRKFGVTTFLFAHSEKDVHQMIRHKLRWRVQMPGTANPTSPGQVVGFDSLAQYHDMTSKMRIGQGLMYTETHFEKFAFDNMWTPSSHKLKIEVEA